MASTVGDFLWQRLHGWGVRRVYGYPGDGINGLIGALDRAREQIDFIQARHEEMAAFMACAHAKYTGEVGVCLATSGPGAIHLLNGLYDARLDHMPVLAIVGQQARAALGGHYQQEVDLATLFKDVAGAFVQQASVPEQIRHLVDRAMRIAWAERRVTCLILPNDLQELDAVETPPRTHGTIHSGLGYVPQQVVASEAQLRDAAALLNAGRKVAMLVGAGALGATDEVLAVADRLGAGIAKALLGKAAVPDDHPFVTGSIGLLGTRPSWDMMQGCDTLFMIGSGFPYSEFLPKEGQARGVQIDIDPAMLSLRYPMDVMLQGDAAATLRALLPLLEQKQDLSWREQISKGIAEWWEVLRARAMHAADPLNPQRVFWELSPRLPDRVIIAGDSGSHTNWYARDVKLRRGMMASLSGGLASMGSGMPYAVAAKFAHPDRPVLAIVGDGAMQMNGMNVLITVQKYWQRWADPRLVVLVLNNRDLNQVTWEQRVMAGDPKFLGSQELPDFAYHRYAELLGFKGVLVDNPDRVAEAWDEAWAADRPVLLEARTDPNVPPLPPHITLKQARAFLASMGGEPELGSVLANTAREVVSTILPGRG
ncbi:Thiamine pyrophosphate-requiring protein [Rhodovastum atsumiense]|uniref:Thiamine pyrophosphate-requiring protein n=1 Tax=Rhodovastum atsumiense TaxID=504468 RepID=A0A5M6IZP1_9PROT|nr:thiamine pyrophosphate-requiring protein [Rhodovastum atsumiense]KAA5613297.1 thiamine pyrophosphate-requiring protein [Rhodovastum atsumiense]CAH2600531.1 Thiamine pyrophosphate-requiring protein [Rhodovastum atsumiense]